MRTRGHRSTIGAGLLAAAAGAALLAAGCAPAGQGTAPGTPPDAAPPAPGTAKAMAPADLLKANGLAGRVVLVEFGAVEGGLSRHGLETMVQWQGDDKVRDLAYLRVELSKDRRAADAYYAANPVAFPVYRDPEGAAARAFDATVVPTFILVDKAGRVRYRGPLPDSLKILEWGEALVAEKAGTGADAPLLGLSRPAARKLLDDTRLPDLAGTVKPLRDYMGKRGLVAVFVDTNCPFSGEAIADMGRVARALQDRQVGAVLVNLAEPKDRVRQFFGERQVGAPVLYDEGPATQQAWQVEIAPTVVLFDAQGTLVHRGRAVWSHLAAGVEEMLALEAGSLDFGVLGTEYG